MPTFDADAVRTWAASLLARAGLDEGRAAVVSDTLVEGDLLGHTTHGLQLLPGYVADLRSGAMRPGGDPAVVNDQSSMTVWDGDYLPGPWLMHEAIALAESRAAVNGSHVVVIRHSHHIACLAAYLRPVAERGRMILIASSDPSVRTVAPFGGVSGCLSPNPIAAGIPTEGAPILIDVSTSTTTNGMTGRLRAQGRRLPHAWVQDAHGTATDDPAVLAADPPGTILPIGGLDHGHKGFGLSLMVEALTMALGGYGRADAPHRWGASVFLLVVDPARGAGDAPFRRQMEALAGQCRDAGVAEGADAVRMPGQHGLVLRERQLSTGLDLSVGIVEDLERVSRDLGIDIPASTH